MQYLRIHFISSFKGNCLNNQEQGGYKKGDPSGKHTCIYFCEDFNGIVGVGKLRAILILAKTSYYCQSNQNVFIGKSRS